MWICPIDVWASAAKFDRVARRQMKSKPALPPKAWWWQCFCACTIA